MSSGIRNFVEKAMKATTLEPMIFMLWFGHMLVYGSGIGVDLLIFKVCHYELGYNLTVCENLKDDKFSDFEAEVQIEVNNFEVIRDWIYHAPPIFFAAVAGALSDKYGRKPLLVFPVIGFLLRGLSSIIIYTFLESLPLWAFIFEEIDCLFGGLGVYHLGIYSYAASITHDQDRANVMARFDGVETLSQIIGAALSPILFAYLGFYGSYFGRAIFTLLGLIYLLAYIREPLQSITHPADDARPKEPIWKRIPHLFYKYITKSVIETLKTLFKKRENNMRLIIFIQFAVYACYKFKSAHNSVTFLYMKRVFDAENYHYATMRSVQKGLNTFALLVIMPFLTKKLAMHDTLIITISAIINGSATLTSAFVRDIWAFLAFKWCTLLSPCQYGAGRSLLSKSVQQDEVAKIFSGKSLIFFIIPYISLPTMRKLYNATINTNIPGAYIILASAFLFIAAGLNGSLYLVRYKFVTDSAVDNENDDNAKGVQCA